MNILYIGPYRQNSLSGMHSSCILQTLIASKKHNVVSRPIYISQCSNITEIPALILDAEKNATADIDCVVQHIPVAFANKCYSINRNIIIPIIGSKRLSRQEQSILSTFDSIFVDNKLDSNKMNKNLGSSAAKKIKNFDYDIFANPINNQLYDLGVLSCLNKLYFIGKASENVDYLNSLIKSFVKQNYSNNLALILYLVDINPQDKDIIENNIKTIYKNYNKQFILNKIMIVPIESRLNNLIIAHNTCDIFIDLQNRTSNTLHTKIAKALNKKILVVSNDVSYKSQDSQDLDVEGYLSVTDEDIDAALSSYVSSKTLERSSSLFKTQNIANIL